MKKLVSALCAAVMLTCSMTAVLTSAEETDYIVAGRYTLAESQAVTDENLVYCPLKVCRDSTAVTPDMGTYVLSPLLEAVLALYPDAVFSVHIETVYSQDTYSDAREKFALEHTADEKTYAQFLEDTQALYDAYASGEEITPEEEEILIQVRRIRKEIKQYVSDLITEELAGEADRLKANGIEMLNPRPGYYASQAYVTASQLRNFPAKSTLGYRISLAPVLEYIPEEEAKHTFYQNPVDLRDYQDAYAVRSGNVICHVNGNENGIEAAYEPNPGTFDCSGLVNALTDAFPEAKLSVAIRIFSDESPDGKGALEQESDRLRENGVAVTRIENGIYYAIVPAALLKNFPVQETLGYTICLAAEPGQNENSEKNIPKTGDINRDSLVNIVDAVMINRAVMGKEIFTEEQNQAADLDKNQLIDSNDSLLLMKYIIGVIKTLD